MRKREKCCCSVTSVNNKLQKQPTKHQLISSCWPLFLLQACRMPCCEPELSHLLLLGARLLVAAPQLILTTWLPPAALLAAWLHHSSSHLQPAKHNMSESAFTYPYAVLLLWLAPYLVTHSSVLHPNPTMSRYQDLDLCCTGSPPQPQLLGGGP